MTMTPPGPTSPDLPATATDATDPETALLARLPVSAKIALLTGADSWRVPGSPEIGLRPIVTSDGPAGVRGVIKDERSPSSSLPCPSALGATWEPALVQELAAALGREARGKAVDVLLAPTINLMRTPLGGRGFECFAEDPVLTAELAVAYVRGVQSAGVAATPKHFVGNDSETQRWTYDALIAEHVLHELYLVPFEAVVTAAGALAVMAAYNSVNGASMTTSAPLLRGVLKGDWGFDGVVMSDWHAARDTLGTALGGLDLVMPGPDGPWGDRLAAAVAAGTVSEAVLDDKVLRLLRLARRVGALVDADSNTASGHPATPPGPIDPGLLRRAAAASFVLLRNEPGGSAPESSPPALPLDPARLRSVTVAGPNAFWPTIQGGGSAGVYPAGLSAPVDAIRDALAGQVTVQAAVGCQTWESVPAPPPGALRDPVTGEPGVRQEFRGAKGGLLDGEHRESSSLTWWDSVPSEIGWGKPGTIVMTASFSAARTGPHLLGASGIGRLTLWLDGEVVIRDETRVPDDPVEAMTRPGEVRTRAWLEAGVPVSLRLELLPAADGAGPLGVRLGIVPAADEDALLDEAVAAAAGSDAAVVVVGSAELTESEGFDRSTLALPGRQDELIARIAAVSPRTIVVVNSGMPVLMPWADAVQAIIYAWLPGQAMGEALADVLLGTAEPGGRLPVTLPAAEADCPVLEAVPDADGTLRYDEGLLIGYRGYDASGVAPRYPFGHGLGYTTWAYESLSGAGDLFPGRDLDLTVRVRNTGTRAGREVVQAYVAAPPGEPGRPVRVLAAFGSVVAGPGGVADVTLRLPARAFARWDERAGGWAWPAGRYEVQVGRSARDLRLTARVQSG
ncbi:MAG TPA: glycoside hydrolase family 3 C-terminal domain-containing protein [Streptosporangiaceae bacterium]|nr:glycoside hydrolase family 3 C-terminal domain-containing protein [Streptosporangiaceae bacterium]